MIDKAIEELLFYAKKHLYLDEEDCTYKRNLLLKYFELDKPYEGEIDEKGISALEVPDSLLEPVKEFLSKKGYSENDVSLEIAWIMGLLSPLPSQVNASFDGLYEVEPKMATDYLYDLMIKNNYIAKSQVDKNVGWEATFEDGSSLEVTINLSKPEKSNKDVAKLVTLKSTSYPKCMLCHENLGFAGNASKPPRETIRVIPLELDDEKWYLQYSPYVYYPHHLICYSEKHEKMDVSKKNLSKLFAFVDKFPHYFIGANADLPIVGGSILDHEHFQGGGHIMPIMKAKDKETIAIKDGVAIKILDFHHPALVLEGKEKDKILELADAFISKWRNYDNPALDIVSHDENGAHNTATSILHIVNGNYRLYVIFRNNRTSEKYPEGIFHAHPENLHIKSEGIGLIEAAGLFILPARLKRQCGLVEDIVSGKKTYEEVLKEYPDMASFKAMVEELSKSKESTKSYMGRICRDILGNIAVFKKTEEGQKAYKEFIKEVIGR